MAMENPNSQAGGSQEGSIWANPKMAEAMNKVSGIENDPKKIAKAAESYSRRLDREKMIMEAMQYLDQVKEKEEREKQVKEAMQYLEESEAEMKQVIALLKGEPAQRDAEEIKSEIEGRMAA